MFSMQSVSEKSLIATFQLSSAASLNLGRSQNDVFGDELINVIKRPYTFVTKGSNSAEKKEVVFQVNFHNFRSYWGHNSDLIFI